MTNDFYIALLSGWSILFAFWTIVILFVYLRKPPNSRLSKKVLYYSYITFLVFLILIFIPINLNILRIPTLDGFIFIFLIVSSDFFDKAVKTRKKEPELMSDGIL